MDRRFLEYYNRELQHLRDLGGEFAALHPKIASRLALDQFECADPYVERLLEGFAFLAARVQLKIDAEFPRFTQHLFESVYPGYLAPMPSMVVAQLEPDPGEGSLSAGVPVPRDTTLRSVIGADEKTPCEYRTGHDVTLWPIEIAEAEYFHFGGAATALDLPALPKARAGLRLRLRTTGGLRFNELALERLPVFLRGSEEKPMHLYEQLLANACDVVVRPTQPPAPWHERLEPSSIRRVGFDDAEALLPQGPRSFSGYRLLREYFAFPERFMFVEFTGLGEAVRRCRDTTLDVIVLFTRKDALLEGTVTPADFALFCTPAVNLFPKRTDRIQVGERDFEYHVVPDKTRPMDFEVVDVLSVEGFGTGGESAQEFLPFYTTVDERRLEEQRAFFTLRRTPRLPSVKQTQVGPRSSYIGCEVYVSLVDANEAPYPANLRHLGISALCTNRDLPIAMTVGQGRTDFVCLSGAPVKAVRCVAGPTKPRASVAEGETAWRLVSHLSLNYLSLTDLDERQGAAALRELLSLYAVTEAEKIDAAVQRQIEGVRSVATRPVLAPLAQAGYLQYVRGLEVAVTFDESAFHGSGVFLLGAVLEQFFARYVSMNSFTETVVRSLERGEITRWPAKLGTRSIL